MAPITEMSSYEKQRLENIEANKKMLESLGLLRSFKPILNPMVKKKTVVRKPKPAVKRKVADTDLSQSPGADGGSDRKYKRRSLRTRGIEPDGSVVLPDDDDEEYRPKPKKINRENYFGAPDPQFYIGYHWETRIECSADGIHRPTVAGIHGNESAGCFSIALSGGYEDDLDYGESFTFTGAGGRDLKGTKSNPKNLRTAPQSKDQTLDKVNLALARNVETREPVRVIRGYKLQSPFAPEYGYRYDGLYTVEKYWACTGLSGFIVYKYVLKRVEDQLPPPWKEVDGTQSSGSDKENEAPAGETDANLKELKKIESEAGDNTEEGMGGKEAESVTGGDIDSDEKEKCNAQIIKPEEEDTAAEKPEPIIETGDKEVKEDTTHDEATEDVEVRKESEKGKEESSLNEDTKEE